MIFKVADILSKLNSDILYSGIFSLNENLLKCNIRKVKNDLKNIKDILSILEKGGVLKNKVSINFVNSSTLNKEFYLQKEEKLFYINDIKATLSLLYPFIDKVNKTKGEYTLYYLKLIPSIIERIKENTNNYLLFTEEQLSNLQKEKEKIEYALYWTQKIENAIRNDLIVPVFQKIVDKNGNLFKYEMLLRVKDKDKLIPPFFLDIALQNNQYFDISKIMFKKAIEYINTKKISLSFNIFYLDIQNKNMYSFFKEEIKKCLYLELLTFEILESADIKDYELLNNKLEFFRNLGCKLAIDDFGSGYSNYRHILELKPNFLKIDGSLVKDILEDKNSLYIVESLQSLAKKTNIKTIAEFVENEEIFNKLKEIGIDYYQGYYFSKPSLL